MAGTGAEGKAASAIGGRTLLISLIVASAFFMEQLDATIIVTAMPQMAHARQLRMFGAASFSCDRMANAKPVAAATISSTSTHRGHAPRSAKWPCS